MSDIFRKSVLNRLPAMPPTRAPWAGDADEDVESSEGETEDMEGGDSMAELGQALPTSSRSRGVPPAQDLSPISASSYFAQALEVSPTASFDISPTSSDPSAASGSTSSGSITFRVYYTPPSPAPSRPGDASASPALSSVSRTGETSRGTVLVCHHGAGASGLSFATLAKEVRERDPELGVLAFDARGHGKTRTIPVEAEHDLSLLTLTTDCLSLIRHMYPEPKSAPALLLTGHSMGAAPVLSAAPVLQKEGYSVPGVIVLDVVEGTAVESLPLMQGILAQRPKSFRSVVDGIHWHVTSHAIRNTTSARVSVPSYLSPAPATEQDQREVGEKQVWRADLLATEAFWQEWWAGLSQKFLSARCARLLVLAGQERLDKDLMVGQMQGKFQLEVMQDVGHYLHEDDPARLAETIIAFWRRNTRVLVLPPKVGQAGYGTGGRGVEVRRVGEA